MRLHGFSIIIIALIAFSCDKPSSPTSSDQSVEVQPTSAGVRPASLQKIAYCGNQNFPSIGEGANKDMTFISCGSTIDKNKDARFVAAQWSIYMTDPTGNSNMDNKETYLCGKEGSNSIGTPSAELIGTSLRVSWGFVFCHQYKVTRLIDGITTEFIIDNKTDQMSHPTTYLIDATRDWSQPHNSITYTIEGMNFHEILFECGDGSVTIPANVQLSASISGPTWVTVPGKNMGTATSTWNALVVGGSSPHTYEWKYAGMNVGQNSSSYTRSYSFGGYGADGDYVLSVIVDGTVTAALTIHEDGVPYDLE